MARPRNITRATPYTPTRGAFAGRTFSSQREYDNARARLRGFASEHERRQTPKVIRTLEQAAGLRRSEQATRVRALNAVADMRGEGLSLAQAAWRNHTTTAAVKRYAAPALSRAESGRYRASRSDGLLRRMRAITAEGVRPIALSGRNASRDASLVARHQHAVVRALAGDEEELDRLIRAHGDRLDALGLETNIVNLSDLATSGELDDLDDPYAIEEVA